MKNLRVLNTRPKNQAKQLTQTLRDGGCVVVECPTLEIKPTPSQWLQTLPDLRQVAMGIFVSVNAVHFFFKGLKQQGIDWPSGLHVIAIGQATADALEAHGIKVHEIPSFPDSTHVVSLPSVQQLTSMHSVLLIKGVGGRPDISNYLISQKINIIPIEVYKRELPQVNSQQLADIWRKDQVDIILLTSIESLHNLFELFGVDAKPWLISKCYLVLSERIAQAASGLGIKNIMICHPNQVVTMLLGMNS